jgi:hypothetical protein
LPQAHARLEQYEEERTDTQATYPRLRAVELDDELFVDTRPSGRGAARRPSGAAVDYARGSTGDRPRRTVQISGYGAQTALRPTPSELRGPRPDRLAAWAVAFAVFLALLAAFLGS